MGVTHKVHSLPFAVLGQATWRGQSNIKTGVTSYEFFPRTVGVWHIGVGRGAGHDTGRKKEGICQMLVVSTAFLLACQSSVDGSYRVYRNITWEVMLLNLNISVLQLHWLINQRERAQSTMWRMYCNLCMEEGFRSRRLINIEISWSPHYQVDMIKTSWQLIPPNLLV